MKSCTWEIVNWEVALGKMPYTIFTAKLDFTGDILGLDVYLVLKIKGRKYYKKVNTDQSLEISNFQT